MTTRERVLMAAMAAGVAWGASTLGVDYYRKHRPAVKIALRQAEIRGFAESRQAQVAPLRLSERERMVLNEAVSAWAPSPFIDRETLAAAVEEPVQQFFYTGFIRAGSRTFAILNGREYGILEPVAKTDFHVESIEPDKVVLVSSSGGRRKTIAMQTSNEKRASP